MALKEDTVGTGKEAYAVERDNGSAGVSSGESLKGVVTDMAHHEVLRGRK